MLTSIIGFSISAIIVAKNEFTTKWGKHKLTLPVKRADIVKSQFLNQVIWLLVGVFWMFSILCAFGIDYTIITILNSLLELGITTIVFGTTALIVCSLAAFGVSYPVTVGIFERKEY